MTRDHGNNKWQLQDLRQALKKEINILESGLPTLTSEMHPATASFFTSTGSNPQRTRLCDQQEVGPASGTSMDSKAPNFVPAHAPGGSTPGSSDDTLQVFHSTTQPRSGVLLKTAVAQVTSRIYTADANILFDEGAQRSFVTRELADKLQLQTSGTEVVQLAAFGSSSKKVSHIDTATVYLLTDSREKIAIDVLIVPTIAVPLGNSLRDAVSLPYLRGLKLAHLLTGEDIFSISLLIGADKYWDIVGNRVIRGDGPTAVQSKIDYLLSGPLPTPTTDTCTATDCIMSIITSPPDTYAQERFGKLETLSIQSEIDDDSSEYVVTYQRNCTVFKDRRYSPQLPWKPYRAPDPPPLPKIRVQDATPFTVTGVDFTGALHIRGKSGIENAYICLFTCASTASSSSRSCSRSINRDLHSSIQTICQPEVITSYHDLGQCNDIQCSSQYHTESDWINNCTRHITSSWY